MKKTFSTLALICGAISAFAQTVTGLGFQPDTVRPGEQATYTISIVGASPKIDLNQIPIPDGLQFAGSGQQQNISMGTGMGMKRETKLNLYFIPSREGEFEIKSWHLKDCDKTYEIAASKLKADANAPQRIAPRPADPFDSMFQSRSRQPRQTETIDLNKETGLSLKLGDSKIFIGQTVPCELLFTLNGKVLRAGYTPRNIMQPQIKNGDAFNCAGFFSDPKIEQSPSDLTATFEYDTFITPIKAGEHEIQFEIGGELIGEPDFDSRSLFAMMGGFGERHPFQVQMKPVKIKVEELPAPPADFSNAIGSFKIESAVIDEASLSVGMPATITLKISGEGNFERMGAPVLVSDGNWKDYKPKVSFEDLSGGFGYKGVKTFEYTIVPSKPDLESAPIARLVFFNPQTEKYETLESAKIEVSVAPSKSFAKRSASQEKTGNPLGGLVQAQTPSAGGDFYTKAWFWIMQLALLAAAVFAVAKKRAQNRLEADPAYARVHAAKRELKEALKLAKGAARANDAKVFFENAALSLQCSICIISGLEAKAVTLSDAERVLGALDGGMEIYSEAKAYFEGADAILFGGYTPDATELASLYERLESICQKIS